MDAAWIRIVRRRSRLTAAAFVVLVAGMLYNSVARAQATYTWNGSGSAIWTSAARWTPTRTSPAATDILVFDGTVTPTPTASGVITQTIGELVLTNGAAVTLQGVAPGPVTLTISGGTGTDLSVPAACALTTNSVAGRVTISLAAAATGLVAGNLDAAGQLTAAGAASLTFASGGVLTCHGLTGTHVFGTTSLNSVVFQSGSTYVSSSGGDPFGAVVPASVVTFQAGSVYRHDGGDTPSLSGRTYADFELNGTGGTASGARLFTVDNLSVTSGSMTIQVDSILVRRDLLVPAGSLGFTGVGSGQTIFMSGTSLQTVTGGIGTSPLTYMIVTNPAGVAYHAYSTQLGKLTLNGGNLSLTDPPTLIFAITGQLNLVNGILAAGNNVVNLGQGCIVSGGSTASHVSGKLSKSIVNSVSPTQVSFEVGDGAIYAPATLLFPSVSGPGGSITASTSAGDHVSIGTSGLVATRSVNRTWSIASNSMQFPSCAASFAFVPGDVDSGANTSQFVVRKFETPGSWIALGTGTRTPTGSQALGIGSFDSFPNPPSDFQIAELAQTVQFAHSITASAGSGEFGAKTDFTTGPVSSSPWALAIGDVNRDGNPDLAVANYYIGTVAILLGDGSGGFSAATSVATGGFPQSIALADVSGDGDPDLLVPTTAGNAVSVHLGNGVGGFGPANQYTTGTQPYSIAMGDLNGDGKLDLATANNQSASVSVLLGDGTGSFGPKTDFAVGSFPQSVAIADVNGDGKLDLAVANGGPSTASVLLGNGSGGFGSATHFATGSFPISVAIGDLSGDGKPDLVVANANSNSVSVLLGNGLGGFGPKTDQPTGQNPHSVAIGDLNADGRLDLVVTGTDVDSVSILLGDGAGGFGTRGDLGTGTQPFGVAIGDVSGDGLPDLAIANGNSANVSVLLGTGGSIAPHGVTGLANGASQSYVVTPASGFAIENVRVDGVSQGAVSNYSFTNVTANHRIEASFFATQLEFTGLVNSSTGGARLRVTGGALEVSNIGSSGNDGVSFPASAPDEGRSINFAGGLPIDTAVDQGGSVVVEMTGTAAGVAASLGTIRMDVVSDGMNITPNFSDLGSTDVDVEAFLNGSRVHSCRVPNGTAMHRAATGSLLRGSPNQIEAAGDGIEGVQVGLKKKPGGQLASVTFTTTKTVTINGAPVSANKLQFSVVAPKQPVTAATAVLKVAKPASLLATKGGNSIQAPSNLSLVLIGSELPVIDAAGDAGGGIRVEPVGTATFVPGSKDDGATVTGIGSSGNDGVELVLNSSSGATHNFGEAQGFDTATDAGAFLEHRLRGKVGCAPDSTVGVSMETVYPDSITLGSDFSKIGATAVKITILDNGATVHEANYSPGQHVRLVEPAALVGIGTHAASINTSRSNLKDKAALAGGGVKITYVYKRPGGSSIVKGGGAQTESQTAAMPFDMMIGASRFQGDEVRFAAVGGTSVTELTGASLRQKNPGVPHLDTLRLARSALAVGATAASNTSKGSADLLAVNGKLVVHNIGSSGNDGVKVAADASASVLLVRPKGPGTASAWPGASAMNFTSVGSRAGGPAQPLIAVGADKVGSALRMGPKSLGSLLTSTKGAQTEATTYRLELLLNGAVISTADALTPQVDFDRLPDNVFSATTGPAIEGRWDTPLSVTVVGGATMMADGLRIRPLGDPDNVTSVAAMDVNAAGIPSFELGGWQFPTLDVTPGAAVGSALRLTLGRNPISRGDALDLAVSLPQAAWVDLDVFDAQGRKVAAVFHGMQAPGTTRRGWLASQAVTSGVYFARLRVAGKSQSQKFIFMQ